MACMDEHDIACMDEHDNAAMVNNKGLKTGAGRMEISIPYILHTISMLAAAQSHNSAGSLQTICEP